MFKPTRNFLSTCTAEQRFWKNIKEKKTGEQNSEKTALDSIQVENNYLYCWIFMIWNGASGQCLGQTF